MKAASILISALGLVLFLNFSLSKAYTNHPTDSVTFQDFRGDTVVLKPKAGELVVFTQDNICLPCLEEVANWTDRIPELRVIQVHVAQTPSRSGYMSHYLKARSLMPLSGKTLIASKGIDFANSDYPVIMYYGKSGLVQLNYYQWKSRKGKAKRHLKREPH